ncbi:IS110 family transposase [Trebonia sp.]|uniref:IS110 family transposase n=1 Tax=Trebonia sp. TaxID=2767075 RepID=UPI002633B24D|nr:IS110 family transposase [Trebonia sp.]
MMVFGVDPHKQARTAAAADELGRKIAEKTVRARQEGYRELISWARDLEPGGRLWAVEDVRHAASGLVRELLAAGEEVRFIPARLMAGTRSGGRERGKSGPIDALANARACLREDVFLPAARLNGQVLEVRRLADHRDDLVAERTRVMNRLRWLVHDLDPDLAPPPRALTGAKGRALLEAGLRALPGPAGRRVALSRLDDVARASAQIAVLTRDLQAPVSALCPELPAICGAGVVSAARIPGETGDIRRFRSPAAYARHNGTAPIPVSSALSDVHRLNRGGNRQVNAALHRAALTQARCHDGARALPERRATQVRETRKAALRVLKRHLSGIVYRALQAGAWRLDQPSPQAA